MRRQHRDDRDREEELTLCPVVELYKDGLARPVGVPYPIITIS